MSLFKFKASPTEYQRKLKQIEDRIANAQAAVADLERDYEAECLQTADGATVEPVERRGQLTEARHHLQDCLAAKRGLEAHRGEVEREAAENEIKRQKVETLLKRQAKAAQDMDNALEAFTQARAELLSVSAELFSGQSHPQLRRRQHIHPGCPLRVDAAIQLRMKAAGVAWALEITPQSPPPTLAEHVTRASEAARVDMESAS